MNLKEKLLTLPQQSGCYIMKDINGNVIYVGKAKNLKNRVNSYFNNTKKNIKTESLVNKIHDFDYIVTKTEFDCLILENNLIKQYQPYYNILLKDDKNFPYIKINLKEDFPSFEITRKIKKDGYKYFGPYFAGINAYEILDIVNNAFNLKTCKQKFTEQKPLLKSCLNYSLGLCNAPCINNISKAEYKKNIDNAIDFLNGNTKQVEQILNNKMEVASDNLNFERAIQIREQLKSLSRLKAKYLTQFVSKGNYDIINGYFDGINACMSVIIIRSGKMLGCENFNLLAVENKQQVLSQFILQYYSFNRIIPQQIIVDCNFENKVQVEKIINQLSNKKVEILISQKGDKKRLLELAESNAKEYLEKSLTKQQNKLNKTVVACERLQSLLNLKQFPKRIECYDISHISGVNKVASMVVFINGEPLKNHYRKFNIKTVEGNNDFASLQETLKRRILELSGKDESFSSMPNLIVIDGGKGQLSSVYEVLNDNNFNVDIISLAEKFEEIYLPHEKQPIILKRSDVALKLLQNLRDEAHRFAITFHRKKQNKTMVFSELDNIKGLGTKRKKMLLKKFKSVELIRKLSLQQLCEVLPQNTAQLVYNKLNKL